MGIGGAVLDAFEEIYETYGRDLYRYLLSLTRDRDLAEELTQETFYKAFRAVGTFKGECTMFVWLCQIGKNGFYTALKRKKKAFSTETPVEEGRTVDTLCALVDKETFETLSIILNRLEDPYQTVFNLRHYGELSFARIGELQGKTDTWARVTYFRAKEKIRREYLEKEEGTP